MVSLCNEGVQGMNIVCIRMTFGEIEGEGGLVSSKVVDMEHKVFG